MQETIADYIKSLVSSDEEYEELVLYLFKEYQKYALNLDGSYSIEFGDWLDNEELH